MSKYFMLFLISLIWGSQFFFVALLIEDVGAITLSAIKAFIGAICLLFISLFLSKDERTSKKCYLKWYVLIAFFEVVLPFILIAQGQKTVPSSIASMLIGMVPLFTLLFLIVLFKKKCEKMQGFSILLGFLGILILSWPANHTSDVLGSVQGHLFLLLAAVSFAFSLILMEQLTTGSSVIHMRNVLFIASIILIPMAFIFEQPQDLTIDFSQSIYLLILGIFHAGVVYLLLSLLIQQQGAIFTSLTNYLVPAIGILLGYFILQEDLTVQHVIGVLIISISLIFADSKWFHYMIRKNN